MENRAAADSGPDVEVFGRELPVPVQCVDGEGRFVSVNRAWLALMGYEAGEVTGRRLTEFMEPGDAKVFRKKFARLKSSGGMGQNEYRFRAADGEARHLLAGSLVFRDPDGAFVSTLCLLQDITEQRRAEQAHAEAEDRFRQLVENMREAFWVHCLDTERILYASPAFGTVYHTPVEDFLADPQAIFRRVHPEDLDLAMKARRDLQEKGDPMVVEHRLVLDNGETRWISARALPLRNQEGRPYRITAIAEDVTDRVLDRQRIETLARFPQENPQPVLRLLPDATVTYANNAGQRLLRACGTEVGGRLCGDYLRAVELAFAENRPQSFETEAHGAYFAFTVSPVAEQGYANLYGMDITRRKVAEDELGVLAQAVEQSPAMVMITDPEGVIEYVNPAFTRVTGYALGEVMGKTPGLLRSGRHDKTFYRQIWDTLRSGREWRGEFLNKDKQGRTFWQSASISPVTDGTGQVAHYVSVAEDVTARKAAEERIRHLALHDQLTGLPNRVLLMDRLGQALARIGRSGHKLGVLYADLDGFKPVNDQYGHQAGDEVLVQVAERLTQILRKSDTAARMGGDEFVLLLDAITGRDQAERVAERIRARLADPFMVLGVSLTLSVSVGVCMAPEHGLEPDLLIRRADQAMYEAKKSGAGHGFWEG